MSDLRQLLGEIAHCPVAKAIRLGDSPVFVPCHNVVSLQAGKSFQLPEPWSGQIDTAPLLFVSSNPAIDELEVYPDESWEDGKTTDFFQKRFTSEDRWVIDGRALQQGGRADARYHSGDMPAIGHARFCNGRSRPGSILH